MPCSSSLRIRRLSVPKAVEQGSPAWLSCDFELEGETLYSVRWYRDYVEFYRYLPSNAPTAAYPVKLKGAYVDVSIRCTSPQTATRCDRHARMQNERHSTAVVEAAGLRTVAHSQLVEPAT